MLYTYNLLTYVSFTECNNIIPSSQMVNKIQEYIALCITYEVWDLLQVTRHSAHGPQPEQIKEWGKT